MSSTSNSDDVQPPKTSQTEPSISNDAYSNVEIDPTAKAVKTPFGQLPISPLMDPAFHQARQRFTQPKPRKTEHSLVKWQRHLSRNPYGNSSGVLELIDIFSNPSLAQALATSVRKCPITGVALPSFFLQRFNLIAHPETQTPWFVPHGLETKVPAASMMHESKATEATQPMPDPATPTTAEPEASEAAHPGSEPAESPSLETERDPPAPVEEDLKEDKATAQAEDLEKIGPAAYTLSRQQLLQELQRDKSPYFRGQKRLLRMSQYGQSKSGSSLLNDANWRRDMDTVLLEIMRRRVVEGLCHFARLVEGLERHYLIKCKHWDDVKELNHRGCLLYLGSPDNSTSLESASEYVPPRLSTMDMGPVKFGAKLTVHNLRELLGEKHLGRLRQQSELLQDGSLYLLGRQATVSLQMLLWKLQGYMAWEKQQGTTNPDGDAA